MELAAFISVLLHPFICTTIAFVVLLSHSVISMPRYLLTIAISFAATVLIPAIQVTVMKRHGRTSSLDIPERENRIRPFISSIVTYFIALLLLWLVSAPKTVIILMWAYFFNTIIATTITRFWKISIHAMALGGVTAALGCAVSAHYFWGILLLLPMAYGRIKVKAHNLLQVITGFSLGFVLTMIHYQILLRIL
ncbi:MAG: hypothetical protein J7L22_01245 [Candidatus Marinimicrobia bacterium]|nr:hypothetical protein [Candidatus Neomarinimicrobiota bacterium]